MVSRSSDCCWWLLLLLLLLFASDVDAVVCWSWVSAMMAVYL